MKPYCFVLMPFGRKTDESGCVVEFDKIYDTIIRPAIEQSELNPIRADEEVFGGIGVLLRSPVICKKDAVNAVAKPPTSLADMLYLVFKYHIQNLVDLLWLKIESFKCIRKTMEHFKPLEEVEVRGDHGVAVSGILDALLDTFKVKRILRVRRFVRIQLIPIFQWM